MRIASYTGLTKLIIEYGEYTCCKFKFHQYLVVLRKEKKVKKKKVQKKSIERKNWKGAFIIELFTS